MKYVRLIVWCLLLVCSALAQTLRLDGGASISTSHDLGYRNPNIGIYGNVLYRISDRVAVDTEATFLPVARKLGPGDGHAVTGRVLGRVYLDEFNYWNDNPVGGKPSKLYVAGGIVGRRQWTSQWKETAASWIGGAGYTFNEHLNGQITYEFADFVSEHRGSAVVFEVEKLWGNDRRINPYFLKVKPFLSIVRFDQGAQTRTGFRLGVSFGFGGTR